LRIRLVSPGALGRYQQIDRPAQRSLCRQGASAQAFNHGNNDFGVLRPPCPLLLTLDLVAEDREDSTFDKPSEHFFYLLGDIFAAVHRRARRLVAAVDGMQQGWMYCGSTATWKQHGLCITVLPIHAKFGLHEIFD